MAVVDSFDKDPANYDRWRPTYCKQLFGDIIDYAQLTKGQYAVEIGIGTGQATTPFLELGCIVEAVELGDNLAAFSKNKFSAYKDLHIVNCSFEDYRRAKSSVDIVYSATAFHWIPEDIGYPKIYRILRNGGTLALFWNRPSRPDDALHQSLQRIYDKYMPSNKPPIGSDTERYRRIAGTISQYGFRDVEVKLYHGTRSFTADEYIGLLNTYSDHITLTPDIKKDFEAEIRQAILEFDDSISISDTMDLYLARK